MMFCYILGACLGVLLLLYVLFELHYFLRMCLCVVSARYIKKRMHIMDTSSVIGVCLTNDVDTLLYHMNNARYLRELDFARVDFYERTLLYKTIVSKGGAVVQGSATIRYRRFIRPFTRFQITSRIVYWDDQSIFMEHRFIGPSDGFIHCVALCRQRVIQCSAEDVMATLLKQNIKIQPDCMDNKVENGLGGSDTFKIKPDIPLEVAKWMEWNDISSANLRNGC